MRQQNICLRMEVDVEVEVDVDVLLDIVIALTRICLDFEIECY